MNQQLCTQFITDMDNMFLSPLYLQWPTIPREGKNIKMLTWKTSLIFSKSDTKLFACLNDVVEEHAAEFGYVYTCSTFNT